MNMNINQTLALAGQKLKKAKIPNPRLEAEFLLSHILKKPREYLLAHPEKELTKTQIANYKIQITKRSKNLPAAYITGHQQFYGLDFLVNKNVLIPRPETELMVEEALNILERGKSNLTSIIDVGTGSGCVIISLMKQILKPKFSPASSGEAGQAISNCHPTSNYPEDDKFLAIDISQPALTLARKNALKHGVEKQIKFSHGNLLEPVIKNNKFSTLNSKFLILANLPYLTRAQINNSPTIQYEPRLALTAGPDSLKYYRQLFLQIAKLRQANKHSGYILCEIDPGQTKKIKQLIEKELNCLSYNSYERIRISRGERNSYTIKKDLKGHNRLIIIKL